MNWKGGKIKKECQLCKKEFLVYPKNKQIFCSKDCAYKSGDRGYKISQTRRKNKSYIFSEEWKKRISEGHKGQIAWNKGIKVPQLTGNKNGIWQGNNVGYRALHHWVHRWLGKPYKCEFCGKIGKGKEIHWANKSHNYLRNLTDWIQLCRTCHFKYDKEVRANSIH